MVKHRAHDDIGPSTNGLALPDETTLPYPLRVQAIYVRVSDYVKPDTHPIYTVMDSAGAQHTYSFDLPGQVTKVLVRPGQIFTKRARMFEFCCDSQAQTFASDIPPSNVKPLSAPPIPARKAAAQTHTRSKTGETEYTRRPRKRVRETLVLGAIAALVSTLVIASQTDLLSMGKASFGGFVAQQPVDKASSATIAVSE